MGSRKTKVRILRTVAILAVAILVTGALSSLYWGQFWLPRNSHSQLQISAAESSTMIEFGSNLSISMEVFNDGPTSNFSWSHSWPIIGGEKGGLAISHCGLNEPFGLAVVSGYVSSASIISGKPLILWKPGIYFCPALYIIKYYEILGFSDISYIIGSGSNPHEILLNATVTLAGYWIQPYLSSGNYQFVYFPRGQYTIIVGDEWGGVRLLHFQVS